jgi:adenylylsulfate reductase subunit A
MAPSLPAADLFELAGIWEFKERLTVAKSLIAHLEARRETRWPGFGEYSDYPLIDPKFECFVNSRLVNGRVKIIMRPISGEDTYEHNEL